MKHRIAVVQMNSRNHKDDNLEVCRFMLEEAAKEGVRLISFPENFAFFGADQAEALASSEPMDGPTLKQFRKWAQTHSLWISLGGFLVKDTAGQAFNTHFLMDPTGEIRAHYQKIHLFSAQLPTGYLSEAQHTQSGDHLVVIDTPVGRVGLSICYDLRFPEMFASMAQYHTEVMLIPAAFTEHTGKDHWEVLLRARAIETQSYVAAAAQTGQNAHSRHTHGHAMIVDPWGNIVAQASEGTRLVIADIDLHYIQDIRKKMPVLKHRKPESYQVKTLIEENN